MIYKSVQYLRQFVDLRQVNVVDYTNWDSMTVSFVINSKNENWANYLGIKQYPCMVISLNQLYDCVIQGNTSISMNGKVYEDAYLLNDEVLRLQANLFENSASVPEQDRNNFDSGKNYIDYEKGFVVLYDQPFNVDVLTFASGVRITDNQFICIIKPNEFTGTFNDSAKQANGQYITQFVQPYFTTIGIYDYDDNLLMVAKMRSPIKKSNKVDMVIKLQMDI